MNGTTSQAAKNGIGDWFVSGHEFIRAESF